MGIFGSFIEKNILHHQAVKLRQRLGDVLGIRIGLNDVFALAIHAFELPRQRGIEHVWNAQTRLRVE